MSIRVLMIADEWFSARGGLSSFNRHLCQAMATAGAHVSCTALDPTLEEHEDAERAGVLLVPARPLPGREPRAGLSWGPDLAQPPDAVVGHGRITGPDAVVVAERFPDAKRLHIVHMTDEIEFLRPGSAKDAIERAELNYEAEFELARTAYRSFAVGPHLHDFVRQALYPDPGVPEPLELIPGFDAAPRSVRGQPPGRTRQILLSGRLRDWEIKGLDIAAGAVGRTIESADLSEDDVAVLLRGADQTADGSLRRQFREWAGIPGLAVTPRPYTAKEDRLTRDLLRSTVALMPSRAEGFGLVGVEAIVAGVPVLVSHKSGLGRLLGAQDSDACRRAVVSVRNDPNKDLAAWSLALAAVLRNPASAYEDAAEVSEYMSARYTWKAAAETILSALGATCSRLSSTDDRPDNIHCLRVPQTWNGLLQVLKSTQFDERSWPSFVRSTSNLHAALAAELPSRDGAHAEARRALDNLAAMLRSVPDYTTDVAQIRVACRRAEMLRRWAIDLLSDDE